jgi:ribonuclease HI
MQKKKNKIIEVYCNGVCEPCNPRGIACYAFIIEQQQQNIIHSDYGLALAEPFTDDATDNVAQYTAVIKALEWLLANRPNDSSNRSFKIHTIVVKGDSQLVINQIKGKRKVKEARIIPLYKRVRSLISKFKNIKIKWIPVEQNKHAGTLSYLVYEWFLDDNPQLHKNITQYMATPRQIATLKKLGISPRKYRGKEDTARLIAKMTKPV